MKQLSIYLLIFFMFHAVGSHLFSQNRNAKTGITEDLFYQRITDSVFLITHYFPPPFGCNSLLVVLPDSKAVLIDTPNETSGTKSLVDWIDERFGPLELRVINTGFHQDNLGGNEYLISHKIPVYGSDLTAQLISEKEDYLKELLLESTRELQDRKFHESYQSLHFMPPDSIFPIQKGLIMKIGDESFEVYYPGESHTIDNVVVYIHKRNILFGGCMIYSMERQTKGFIRDANLEEWAQALLNVKNRFQRTCTVIPGHGSWGDLSLIEHTIEVLQK